MQLMLQTRSMNEAIRPNRRILHVMRLLPELDFGGVESRVVLQSRMHTRERYRLSVCTFHKPGAAAEAVQQAGVEVQTLGVSPAPRRLASTLRLAAFLRRARPDVLHASIAEANFHGIMAARLAGVPVVIAEETGMPSHSLTARAAYAGLYALADAVVGVTQAVCDYSRQVDFAPPSRVRLIYNCARGEYFPTARREPVSRREGDFRFLLVGRLVEVKNHELLLRAFAKVAAARPRVSLRIVGEGPLRDRLESQVKSNALQDRVQLMGFRADIREQLVASDAFLLPSLAEGCSISLIEAMATGVPVLGSDVPGIREVMGPVAPDWTAPARDEAAWVALLCKLIDAAPAERVELARTVQAIAYTRFSPQAYLGNVERMYDELWNTRATSRSQLLSKAFDRN
jgi:glycosyltransferase involved in cell wall biosynthesis